MSSCFPRKDYNNLENGALLLKKQFIATGNGKRNPIRSFSAKELKAATQNYDKRRIITDQEIYKLYNGFLQDRQISILKFEDYCSGSYGLIERHQSINNIVFASQMKHKNFLKLIGCCLETRIPILVFDSIGCGTLADCIQGNSQPHLGPLLLKLRLKIALEIANNLAYLHIGFPRTIVFGRLQPSNILLDEQYVVKLFDFSQSKFIPDGETHVNIPWPKRIGREFVPPESSPAGARNKKSICNEKFDVYGFGASLFMLLSGQSLNNFLKNKGFQMEDIGLDNLNEVIDPVIVGEGICSVKEQQLLALARLVSKCCCTEAEERPNMIDVAKQLRQMYKSS